MASRHTQKQLPSNLLVVKEGFLNKRRGIIKIWNRRYFVLSRQSLVYFRKEQELDKESLKAGLSPLGRIFLSDIIKIEAEELEAVKKSFVFGLYTRRRTIFLQAADVADRDDWIRLIRGAMVSEDEAEFKDPFRKTLRKLAPGLKRITLMKDPEKGIGCTIKSAGGHIFVSGIIEDGPIAHTGVLRPDDELLDVNGILLTGMTLAEVGKVIRSCPDEFLATVRPITALKKLHPRDISRSNYVTIVPNEVATPRSSSEQNPPHFLMKENNTHTGSLEDVGNYDDEEEGEELPPPVPLRTGEALTLLEPPPDSKESTIVRSQSLEKVQKSDYAPKRQPRKIHVYEDIKPKMNYVDVLISSK